MARIHTKHRNHIDSGIHIEINSYATNVGGSIKRWQIYLMQYLLLISSVLSGLYYLVSSMQISIQSKELVIGSCLFALFFLSLQMISKIRVVATISALYIAILYICEHSEQYLQGVYHIENYAIKAFNEYYEQNNYLYMVASADGSKEVTFLFLILAFLLSMMGAGMICRGRFQYCYLLLSVLECVLPCIVGRLPNGKILIWHVINIVGIIGIMPMYRGKREKGIKSRHKKLAISVSYTYMIISLFVVGIISICIRQERYQQLPLKEWKKTIQQLTKGTISGQGTSFSHIGKRKDAVVGGLDGGRLDLLNGNIRYNGKAQLIVNTTQIDHPIYLKGYTGVNYTGEAWTEATDEQKEKYQKILEGMSKGKYISDNDTIEIYQNIDLHFDSSLNPFVFGKLSLEYKNANNSFLYYPYYTWFQVNTGGDDELDDFTYNEEYVKPKRIITNCSMQYLDLQNSVKDVVDVITKYQSINSINSQRVGDSFSRRDDYLEDYKRYINQVYLSVPESGLERLEDEFREYYRQFQIMREYEDTNHIALDAVLFVKSYLENTADYSLSPGKTPKTADYIEYFLYENHKGYCAHYASAATIMFRLLGIPARYVEGYYIDQEHINHAMRLNPNENDGNQMRIVLEDSCAHSWVEIYIDGFGWFPVEVTEASIENQNNPNSQESEEIIPTNTPTEKPTVEPTKNPESEHKEDESKGPTEQVNTQKIGVSLSKLRIPILSAFVILVAIGFHKYRIVFWRKYFRKYGGNQLYLCWYQKLEKFWNLPSGSSQLNFSLSEEEWERFKALWSRLSYEEYYLLKQNYLKIIYANESVDSKDLVKMKRLIQQEYLSYLSTRPVWKRFWHWYYVVLAFPGDIFF